MSSPERYCGEAGVVSGTPRRGKRYGRARLAQRDHRLGEEIERPEEAGLQPDHPFITLDRAIAGRQVEANVPGEVDDDADEIENQDQARNARAAGLSGRAGWGGR